MSPEVQQAYEGAKSLEESWKSSAAPYLEIYNKFSGTDEVREAQKSSFLAAQTRNPNLDYPNLSTEELRHYEAELWALFLDVDRHTDEPLPERQAYDRIIGRKLAEVYYLRQAIGLQQPPANYDYEQRNDWFTQQGQELYGLPEANYFNGMVNQLREKALSIDADDKTVHRIATELLNLLPEGQKSSIGINQETKTKLIEEYQPIVLEEFADLLAVVPNKQDKFTPEDMVEVFENTIKYYESMDLAPAGEWQAAINQDSKVINTNQEKKRIEVGSKRKELDNEQMKQLLIHEAGVHLQRRLWGDKANFSALGSGLDGYYDAEEGLGVVMEQILTGQTREAGVQYYTLLGLATGLDGEKRDFRDVYEIAWRRLAVLEAVSDANKTLTEETIKKVQSQAYAECVRIFRGTTCGMPGVVFPKDIAYFNGSAKIWEYLEQIKGNREKFKQLFKGKFDPSEPEHIKLVNATAWS